MTDFFIGTFRIQ